MVHKIKNVSPFRALNKSTLRKVITYGKLVEDIDVCKFGKQVEKLYFLLYCL